MMEAIGNELFISPDKIEGTKIFKSRLGEGATCTKSIILKQANSQEIDNLLECQKARNVINVRVIKKEDTNRRGEVKRHVVLEHFDDTLETFIKYKLQKFDDNNLRIKLLRKFMRDILLALIDIHRFKIIIGNITPRHIAIVPLSHIDDDPLKKYVAKILDFSRSKVVVGPVKLHPLDHDWVTPELLDRNASHTVQVDVFNFGCVIVHTFTGVHPFGIRSSDQSRHDRRDRDDRISNDKIFAKSELFDPYVQNIRSESGFAEMYNLLSLMIKKDSNDRIPIIDARCHPFFWDIKRKTQFLEDTSDYLQSQDCMWETHNTLNHTNLIREYFGVRGWQGQILKKNAYHRKPYKNNVVDFLRYIRNSTNHYDSSGHWPETSLQAFGTVDMFVQDVLEKFSGFLIGVYSILGSSGFSQMKIYKWYYTDVFDEEILRGRTWLMFEGNMLEEALT